MMSNPISMLDQIETAQSDLHRFVKGRINDGDDRSIVYKEHNKIKGRFDNLSNLLPGQPVGAEDLRSMPQIEHEKYNNNW